MSANLTKGDIGEASKGASGLSPAQMYLFIYNLGCAMGWYFVMFKMGSAFIDGGTIQEAVNAAHDVVAILQLVSTLEILHSSIGLNSAPSADSEVLKRRGHGATRLIQSCIRSRFTSRNLASTSFFTLTMMPKMAVGAFRCVHDFVSKVKSSPVTTFMQVVGRDLALFFVVTAFPAVRVSSWVLMMFAAWTASEIIRYPFYALSVVGVCPRVLHWLRYTAFIVLYPLGFMGELGTWIVGLPHIRALGLPMLPGLPRGSSVYALYCHLLFAFGYGAPHLYIHMLRQRRKQVDGVRPKPKGS